MKDDLRFGDVAGGESGRDIVSVGIEAIKILVVGYVLLNIVEILFDIPIPLI